MQLFIKSLSGGTISLDVNMSDTIRSVKNKVMDKERIPVEHQQFIFSGVLLEDYKTLRYYDIKKESTIHLVTRVLFM